MSYDDYAQHMAQKYRLAISIAILSTKPEYLSIDAYIQQIIDENDINNDFNVSVCSDDFNIDSSEETEDCNGLNHKSKRLSRHPKDLLNDNDILPVEILPDDKKTQSNDNIMFNDRDSKGFDDIKLNNGKIMDTNKIQVNDSGNGSDLNTFDVISNDTETHGNGIKIQSNDHETQVSNASVTILHNFEEASEINKEREIDINKERREKFREVIQVLKGVDTVATDKVVNEGVFCDGLQNKPFDPMDMDLTQCYDDDNSTLFESIDKLTNIDKRGNEQCYSQDNFKQRDVQDTLSKQIDCDNATKQSTIAFTQNNNNIMEIKKQIKKRINGEKNNDSKPKIARNVGNVKIKTNAKETSHYNNAIANDNVNFSNNNSLQTISYRDQSQATENRPKITKDTQETQYTLSEYTQFNTHYSPSQIIEVNIDNKLIYGNKDQLKVISKSQNVLTESEKELKAISKSQNVLQRTQITTNDKNYIENDQALLLDTQTDAQPNRKPHACENSIENDTAFSMHLPLDTQNYANKSEVPARIENSIKNNTALFLDTQMTAGTHTQNLTDDSQNDQSLNANEKQNDFDKDSLKHASTVLDKTDRWNIDGKETEETEKIPFKIIEEMNRIQIYLKRKECSSFRTSQSKCSFGSTQQQNAWIGESANSVFNYLSCCPLVTTTQGLIEQLSEVLGRLIDRLHIEEIYPPYLEELLNSVSMSLELLYEEDNYVFDVLLNKDERTQRILLLNKSTHIQKFTINKINNILQKLLDETSADTTYEISNINKIENLCYIFHILEILIPKYRKNCNIATQNSKDDKIIRKIDISDIWRRKWFANKNIKPEGSSENKCVLTECSKILNKIIIDFMDGYSLIAFSALKCFNMMQS